MWIANKEEACNDAQAPSSDHHIGLRKRRSASTIAKQIWTFSALRLDLVVLHQATQVIQ
jgi:hypothetical protein